MLLKPAYLPIKLTFIFVVLASLLSSPQTFALGKDGHRVVCQLAYDLLPANKQARIDQLLANMPAKHQQKINKYNYLNKDHKIDFALSCTWADAIKKDPEFKKFNSWHYMNIDRSVAELSANPCKKDCVLTGIEKHANELAQAPDEWQKTKALMFLGHWVGDIHQPLHVSYANDFGGNKTQIKPSKNAKCKNLHWYWDQCIVNFNNQNFDSLVATLSKALKTQNTTQWQASPPLAWANESLAILREPTFEYCQLDNEGTCRPISESPRTLPDNYADKYHTVMHTRLMQAAVRLEQKLRNSL